MTSYAPDGDKTMRLHAQTATMENGFVHLPRDAHWLADYLHELTTYPAARHDDQVDSASQALAWTKQRPNGWSMVEYYRRLVEEDKRTVEPKMVRLKAPPGPTHIITLSGAQYMVQDGHVTVSEDDARPLIPAGFAYDWQPITIFPLGSGSAEVSAQSWPSHRGAPLLEGCRPESG